MSELFKSFILADYACGSLEDCEFLGNCTWNDHVWHCSDERCICRPFLPGEEPGFGPGFGGFPG